MPIYNEDCGHRCHQGGCDQQFLILSCPPRHGCHDCHPCPPRPRCACVPDPEREDSCSFLRVNCEGDLEYARVNIDNGPLTTRQYDFMAANMNPRDVDPVGMQSASGMLYLSRIELSCPVLVNRIVVGVSDGGTDLTLNGSYVGIYDGFGNLLTQSADQSAVWATPGVYTIFVPEVYLSEGRYYLALVSNGSVTPEFAASQAGSLALNVGLTPPDLAYGQLPGQANLPAMIDPLTFVEPPIGQKMPFMALKLILI